MRDNTRSKVSATVVPSVSIMSVELRVPIVQNVLAVQILSGNPPHFSAHNRLRNPLSLSSLVKRES
jgi:hypothetical protein